VTRQTGAHGVTLSVGAALSVGATGARVTGIGLRCAPVVVTNVSSPTVSVHLTLPLTPGDGVWHRNEAEEAAAHGVTLSVLHALSVGAAWRWLAGVRSGHTPLALTHIALLTVGVPDTLRATAGDGVRLGDQTWLTSADGVALEVDCTDSPRPTRRRVTRVWLLDTSLALANVSLLTVRVNDTFRFTPGDGVRVGDEAGLASTDGVACSCHGAISPRSTWRWVTRVGLDHTPLALANVSLLAIRVDDTLGFTSGDGVRVGDEAGLTSTYGIAIASDTALSSGAAGVWVTRVWLHNTSLALTNVSLLAIGVYNALRAAASDGVRLGDEARLTGANGIASRIDIALGPGSTGVWLTGVWLGGAPVGAADVAHAAVGVYHALGLAAGDGVGGRGEAGHTATLGVTIPVDTAGGAWAAGGGHTGVTRGWRPHTQVSRASSQSVVKDDGGGGELSGRQTPVHWTALGDKAGDTAADGVTSIVDHALSVGAAG